MNLEQSAKRNAEIHARIVEYLANRQSATAEMAREMGMIRSTLYAHLSVMRKGGQIHSEDGLWFLGPEGTPKPQGTSQTVIIVKKWPPHNRREPLVAALFGTSKMPRCSCCGLAQGNGHHSDCRYIGLAA